LLPPAQHRRNVWRLAIAQALAGANSVVIYATGAVVGNDLAPSPSIATLPISIFVVGMAISTLPAGWLAERYGRRSAFFAGTAAGVASGLVAMLAVLLASFWLLCVATFLGGAYAAVVLSFRFAAADSAAPAPRARALSMVMAGGVASGVVGPQMVSLTMHLWSGHAFAATFLCQALAAACSAILLAGVRLPPSTPHAQRPTAPVIGALKEPAFVGAVVCGAVSYMLMNFMMTAAPLAMHMQGHPQEAANMTLQWHVIAMYLPSFYTGKLIKRVGAKRVATTGLLLTAGAAVAGMQGLEIFHFSLSLILLGLGWNFGFLGASALVLECNAGPGKERIQAMNDFLVFGLMAIGSFLSGWILARFGWHVVLLTTFGPLALAAAALAITARRGRSAIEPA
jgi:MFS family permease